MASLFIHRDIIQVRIHFSLFFSVRNECCSIDSFLFLFFSVFSNAQNKMRKKSNTLTHTESEEVENSEREREQERNFDGLMLSVFTQFNFSIFHSVALICSASFVFGFFYRGTMPIKKRTHTKSRTNNKICIPLVMYRFGVTPLIYVWYESYLGVNRPASAFPHTHTPLPFRLSGRLLLHVK